MTARTLYPNAPLLDESGEVHPAWQQTFTLWGLFVTAGKQSGTTADRPTKGLWTGRFYWDTDLDKPIWVKTVSPVAWVDAAGTTV
jgi:hypothetical protein